MEKDLATRELDVLGSNILLVAAITFIASAISGITGVAPWAVTGSIVAIAASVHKGYAAFRNDQGLVVEGLTVVVLMAAIVIAIYLGM